MLSDAGNVLITARYKGRITCSPFNLKISGVEFQENAFYFQAWLNISTADYMKTGLLEVLLRIVLVSAR